MVKRAFLLYLCLTFFLFLLFLRLYAISQSQPLQTAYAGQSAKTVTLYHTRGQIYDRNFTPLTDATAVKAVTIAGKSACYTAPGRDGSLAPHIIGYLSEGKGVSGIEAAYDEFLTQNAKPAKATLLTLGNGNPQAGEPITFSLPTAQTDGVVLTLDAKLQEIVMACEKLLPKGAIVCMDAETAEILAAASFPSYSTVPDALTDPDKPLYNRLLGAYAVGSVFKPIIAAAALESGISPHTAFDCTGHTTVGDIRYGCHKQSGHGVLNLYGALRESCNPYFVQITAVLSADTLLQTAKRFGFGQRISLASGITSSAGTLPGIATAGEKANFSFGQGQLTATPIQICAAYAALAAGRGYQAPTLVRGFTADGKTLSQTALGNLQQSGLSSNTVRILQDALYQTVDGNEDSKARSALVAISGKTGTAQTGQFRNGEELLIGWFAGWFEVGAKKIAIAVMAEEAQSGNSNAAPVVKRIAERACE